MGGGLDLKSRDRSSMFFDNEIHFGAVIGPPKIDARLTLEVVRHPVGLKHHPLLKQASSANRVGRGGQLPVQAVGDAQVKEIEFGMGDQSLSGAL